MAPARCREWVGPAIVMASAVVLAACAAGSRPSEATSARPSPTQTPASPTAPAAPPAESVAAKNWFDLDAGDCLVDPPPVDPNVIVVTLVDCATAHRAEVYLRRPMAVNTALATVADRDCGEGFADYTGRQVGDGPLSVTYLIDSNQNRTAANPNPSTVICLLVNADGNALTGSARR